MGAPGGFVFTHRNPKISGVNTADRNLAIDQDGIYDIIKRWGSVPPLADAEIRRNFPTLYHRFL